MLQNLLATCGFNDTEQKILLRLSSHGESIASLIAKQVGVKRTTVYAALESLSHYGVVGKQQRKTVTYFSMVPPEMFARIVDRHAKETFEELHETSQLLAPALRQITKPKLDFGVFSITTFESIEAVYAQLEDALLGGDFYSIFNPQLALQGKFKPLVQSFLEHTSKTKPKIREIVVPGPLADWYLSHIKNPRHDVRVLSKNSAIFSDIILVKGSVILNHYDPAQETCIKITEKNFYRSMQTVFEELWEGV